MSSTLNVTTPSDKPLLVGIDSKIESLYWPTEEMYKSECVDMLGIYGIRGIGKTTLAKALYNKIASQFEGCCFLSNVREASKQFNGLAQLQKKLLFQILKYDLEVVDLDRGHNIKQAGSSLTNSFFFHIKFLSFILTLFLA